MFSLKQKNVNVGVIFLIFGLLTVSSGGRTLFTDVGMNSSGNIILAILWFNFIAGFFYILAGVFALRLQKTPLKNLSIFLAISNTALLLYLFKVIFEGTLYESRTLLAMSFRTLFWIGFAIYFQKSNFFNNTSRMISNR